MPCAIIYYDVFLIRANERLRRARPRPFMPRFIVQFDASARDARDATFEYSTRVARQSFAQERHEITSIHCRRRRRDAEKFTFSAGRAAEEMPIATPPHRPLRCSSPFLDTLMITHRCPPAAVIFSYISRCRACHADIDAITAVAFAHAALLLLYFSMFSRMLLLRRYVTPASIHIIIRLRHTHDSLYNTAMTAAVCSPSPKCYFSPMPFSTNAHRYDIEYAITPEERLTTTVSL